MGQAKKFGSFAGVFTPSILTILGVIMYMRLGWVVGQAGLINTIGIILVAHIISISTGLSISSIATDKKIRTGGIYYILSRSLGLPMGGSIGIALAVGTALSISLYIVGFSESFLDTDFMLKILGHPATINDYRIVGTIVIILLVIMAFISTSFAIKTQFFILAAILLSLVSIGLGFYLNADAPVEYIAHVASEDVSLEYVFSIFFPAVTGFTAGVAMSGDLQDPKKNIPSGTLFAILVGLLVYIALAVAFAFFVDRETLLNDTSFLMRIAWWSPLVLAGIWGATLSSALGGILGGPRILQAIAMDKIIPGFLGKGSGESNEPRNALIFISVIAEVGILIGELNVIAEVVSMFYLASYGFINLAFALESWASTDFRPTFRVPRFIGIIGFIASFMVMFKLNIAAMFAALTIMLLIFFLLKRKELQLDFGDVWSSVWNSVIRTALHRLNAQSIEERNWQPNIILFSGSTQKRPHLLEFGKSLVGKHGMLSNFDLVENTESKFLFTRSEQVVADNDSSKMGVFTRRQTCNDIFQGIETIASTYGFSGVEPNLVLMGWARQTRNPKRFVQLINNLNHLDLNILLIDYDKRYGYGSYKIIDIWWEEDSNHGYLALFLTKFLNSSEKWRNARIRLIIVNPRNEEHDNIYKNAELVLEQLRIDADVKVINNQIEQKRMYDLIRIESINTDIIFLGVPELNELDEIEFVEQTNQLMHDIGTVVLIKASSNFKSMRLGKKNDPAEMDENITGLNILIESITEIPEITLPTHESMARSIGDLKNGFESFFVQFFEKYLHVIFQTQTQLLKSADEHLVRTYQQMQRVTELGDTNRQLRLIQALNNNLTTKIRLAINKIQHDSIDGQKDMMKKAIEFYLANIEKISAELPKFKNIVYTQKELLAYETSDLSEKHDKESLLRKMKWSSKTISYRVEYKKLVDNNLNTVLLESLSGFLSKWDLLNVQFTLELEKIIKKSNQNFFGFQNQIHNGLPIDDLVADYQTEIKQNIQHLKELLRQSNQALKDSLVVPIHTAISEISDFAGKINPNRYIGKKAGYKNQIQLYKTQIEQIPDFWFRNQHLIYNHAVMELMLSVFENKLRAIFDDNISGLKTEFEKNVYAGLEKLDNKIDLLLTDHSQDRILALESENLEIILDKEHFQLAFKIIMDQTFKDLKAAIDKFPETIDILSLESFNSFTQLQFSDVEIIHVSAARLLDYLVQQELVEPILKIIEELPEKIVKVNSVSQSIIRMLMYSFSSEESKRQVQLNFQGKEHLEYIEGEKIKLNDQINEIKSLEKEIDLLIKERLNATVNYLSIYNYVKVAANFKQYVSKQVTKQRFSLIKRSFLEAKNWTEQQVNSLWFRQSEAKLLARKIHAEHRRPKSVVSQLLNAEEQISPSQEILEHIPFYYQQLFLRKHNYNNEYWFGRKDEIEQLEKSINRIRSGNHGAVLITGEKNSGKTFLLRYLIGRNNLQENTYYISAPAVNGADPAKLKKNISDATGLKGTYKDIFRKLPINSVLVFDDLELWWEKSENGTASLEKILQLVDDYSGQALFLFTMNVFSYRFVNQLINMDRYLVNITQCEPFTSQMLYNIVMFRHESSGLKFKIGNRSQGQMRSVDYASIFAKYFNASKGNVGTALSLWMANIVGYEKREISMRPPRVPDLSILDELEAETNLFLLQFILHKKMDAEKLGRVLLIDKSAINRQLNFMKRSGFLQENAERVYIINPYLSVYILEHLQKIEMI